MGLVVRRPHRLRRLGAIVALALGAGALAVPGAGDPALVSAEEPGPPAPTDEMTGDASRFVPIAPERILDTRSSRAWPRLWDRSAISFDPVARTGVAEAAGVDPDDITAVVVNTTLVGAGGDGFATIWPTGAPRPTTATNYARFEGQNIGNLVIAPLGLERKISVFASANTDVTVDVSGVFVRSASPPSAGRFVQLGPVRHTDTRDTEPMAAGETRRFDLTTAGVPAGAIGVVMNITAFRSNGKGFYTVWQAGTRRPTTAAINVLSEGYAAGNQVVTGVTDGRVDVYTDVGSDLTIDVTGYFTGPGARSSTDGLYVPLSPERLLDTRATRGEGALTDGSPLTARRAFTLPITGRFDIPAVGVKAVALNLTGVQAANQGFVKAYPTDTRVPPTSSLNFTEPGQTVPNHAITVVDADSGSIDLRPSVRTDLTVDATGYFLNRNGVPPAEVGPTKTVDPGDLVPEPLAAAPPVEPYDFLFDRNYYLSSGQRPNPTLDTAYDACAPIRYALNVDLANDQQIEDLIASIETVEEYTGIDFRFAGVTSAGMNIDDEILLPEAFEPRLPYRYLPPGADVVIGYTNGRDTPQSAGGVIGVGGGLRMPAEERMFRGFAVIDLPDLRSREERISTTTHELGHMMGLGHISDFDPRTSPARFSTAFQGLDPNAGNWDGAVLREQLMYPVLGSPPLTTFSTGDAHGLFQLYGTQGPCGGGDDNALVTAGAQPAEPTDFTGVEVVYSD